MNANNNPVRKSIIMFVSFAIAFMAMVSMACDEGPSPDNGYGITSPVTEVEQAVQNALQPHQQDTLSTSGE